MHTFLDLQVQTTFKKAMVYEHKEYGNMFSLQERIARRGQVEQIMAKLHPSYCNCGKRLSRNRKVN